MQNKGTKSIIVIALIAVAFFVVVLGGITLTKNIGKSSNQISEEKAEEKLAKIVKKISATEVPARKATVELSTSNLADELPEITKYPITVKGNGEIDLEIFASPEKSGSNYDGWMIEVAEKFNNLGISVNGKTVSVSIRTMNSGEGADYIISEKYLPDAFSPSSMLWGSLIESQGGSIKLEAERLVGNVAGVLLTKKKQEELISNYGSVNMKTITEATAKNELIMGYTNPLASSTGMNFLLSTLYAFDPSNILSETAKEGFTSFQMNVPYVAFTTMQMRESASSGSLDGMVMEYQTYTNNSDLSRDYTFTPFGYRHDNPIYSVGTLDGDKREALSQFINYCLDNESQNLATKYGFNQLDSYKVEMPQVDGATVLNAQKLWKENKDTGKSITAVFVADISGSMDGEPLQQLKNSLINGAQYINEKNKIGLVTYNSDVYINLPIAEFNLNQRAFFTGAVEDLECMGSTASFDAIAVAMNMLLEEKKANPNTKVMMFLLSDGETNSGHSLSDIRSILKAYEIPVYTIGYNADIEALKTISEINEAASINANSDDVIYKLKSLFNAQM